MNPSGEITCSNSLSIHVSSFTTLAILSLINRCNACNGSTSSSWSSCVATGQQLEFVHQHFHISDPASFLDLLFVSEDITRKRRHFTHVSRPK